MTVWRIVLRSLRYHWRTEIPVVLGLMVATSVIIGSLLVGDSVTGSLRDSALSRLGRIECALSSPGFFRASLAHEIQSGTSGDAAAMLSLRGSAESGSTDAAEPDVTAHGVDSAFGRFLSGSFPHLSGRQAAVNRSLASDLGLRVGDSLLVTIDRRRGAAGTIFSHRSADETLVTLRLTVSRILDDMGVGGFRLGAGVESPRNVFVSREWLADRIGKKGLANSIVTADAGNALESNLRAASHPSDYGLRIVDGAASDSLVVESERVLLSEDEVRAARAAADECAADAVVTSMYLATRIKGSAGRSIAYSVVAAADRSLGLRAEAGSADPGDVGIVLNSWAARDLGVRVGERVAVEYLKPRPDGTYAKGTVGLRVRGVISLDGASTDRSLAPTFEGMTDSRRIDEWETPFPVDLSAITERDEVYWERYHAAPKAFVGMGALRKIWAAAGSDESYATSVRVTSRSGSGGADLRGRFERALVRRLNPSSAGLVFRPVRRMALDSAKATTDFGQLFLAMSFFIILSGAGLAAMLMRLTVERRASEFGTMLACGFTQREALSALLAEGGVLCALGAAAGVPLGVLYSWGVIAGLRTWWIGCMGTSALGLHVAPGSIILGAGCGVLVGLAAVGYASARMRRSSALGLLSGRQAVASMGGIQRRRARMVAGGSLLLVGIAIAGVGVGRIPAQTAFMVAGLGLAVAVVSFVDIWLVRLSARRMAPPSISALVARGMAANRGRSLLLVCLLASAAFITVVVAANVRDLSGVDYRRRDSGTGGFALRVVSSSPLHYDLSSRAGRAALGFTEEDERSFRGVLVIPFLMSDGDDMSCLNIARPTSPRVLGVAREMIHRGGFRVSAAERATNPWTLLEGDGYTPLFGDGSSVEWNLHSGLGKAYRLTGGGGGVIDGRFVGLLRGSIFASEILVSERRFRRMFPEITEPRYFLVEIPRDGSTSAVAGAIRRNLGALGVRVTPTAEVLSEYLGVQNTYLSMFLALGGLGMALGTLGLVVTLLRSAMERRSEFALMLAVGFGRRDVRRLLLGESSALLGIGLALGTVSGLLATAPALMTDARMNWPAVAGALLSMAAVGLVSCRLAAARVVGSRLIEALREE